MAFTRFTFHKTLLLAAIFRISLLFWSFYQDANHPIKYTDIDYFVITDAAACLLSPSSPACGPAQGRLGPWSALGDPYKRDTYRYTPLLALLATPNHFLHPAFAKVIFATADLVIGLFLHSLLVSYGGGIINDRATRYVAGIWLLNPMIANISTRGSSESILGLMVIGVLVMVRRGNWDGAAALFGMAVHWKVYPVIYGASLLAALPGGWGISRERVRFVGLSAGTFLLLNFGCYAVWGHPFLEHTFLYHISRLDHRHNFSPYFYPMYLSATNTALSPSSLWTTPLRHPLASFIPQLGLSILLGFMFGSQDLAFAWFIQTWVFVALNKVCTSQYFLWYLWLLPLVLPRLTFPRTKGFVLLTAWILGQAVWLSQAYLLEMKAEPTYLRVWMAGVGFLAVNCWIAGEVLTSFGQDVKEKKKTS